MTQKKDSKRQSKTNQSGQKTGPKPDILKIEGEWQDAVSKALGKKKPKEGWPKDGKK